MTFPSFTSGEVLRAADMNAVGLWLVKTVTIGAGVTSVPVTGAFSADYDNYLVTLTGTQGSTTADLSLQLGATNTGYFGNIIYSIPSSTTVFCLGVNNGVSIPYIAGLDPVGQTAATININAPFATRNTAVTCPYTGGGTNRAFGNFSGFVNNALSYTAFTLLAGAGTMTGGTIRVYGYRN
jgi:hypothetical protein